MRPNQSGILCIKWKEFGICESFLEIARIALIKLWLIYPSFKHDGTYYKKFLSSSVSVWMSNIVS